MELVFWGKFNLIYVEKLVKIYNGNIVALNNISFKIDRKCSLLVAGPNGAGKTTLLRILATTLLPTSGNVTVLGFDVVKQAENIRKKVAIAPQDSYPDPYMTPEQFIFWYLVARGMSINESRKQAKYALELLQLEHVKNRKCLTLSGGERKRVIVAAIIATNAELLILDEPTAGLDPMGRRAVYDMINKFSRDHGIIMSTHLIGEAEAVAEKVLLINKGRILALDSVRNLLGKFAQYEYRIFVEEANKNLETYLENMNVKFLHENGRIVIYIRSSEELQYLISKLSELRLNFTIKRVNLEDVFIELMANR